MSTDSTQFNLDELVANLKAAALKENPQKAVVAILEDMVSKPEKVVAGMPEFEDNDVILYEDETVSIWHCRFMPGVTVPAHDHQMIANIGVYRGTERNELFVQTEGGGLSSSGVIHGTTGKVISLGPNAIHTVSCISQEPSCAIHVYLGNLTQVSRSLFDTANGKKMPFTDENYYKLHQAVGKDDPNID